MARHVTDRGAIGRRGAESGRLAPASTPGTASAYARYIGRVGALAVALGIGAVVVTGNGLGVAHAQDGADATDSQTTDAPSTTETTVDPSSDPTEPGPSANQGPPESGQTLDNPSVPEMKLQSSGGLIESAKVAKDGDEDPESVVKKDAESVVKKDADPPAEDTVVQPPSAPVDPPKPQIVPAAAVNVPQVGGSTTPAGKDAGATEGFTGGNPLESSELDQTSEDTVQLAAPQAAFGRFALLSESHPANVVTNGQQLKMAAVAVQDNVGVAPVRSPQQGLLALPVALINIAISVVNTLLTPFLGDGGPTAPAEPPLLFALLAWVRNELQRSFGPAPVADTITTSENTQKTFSAAELLDNDTDIPDDVLKITAVSDPAHGTAKLNADGTFTYTPDTDFSGTDTFTYTMSDEDGPFHIHFFAKSYDEPGHTATATVTVNVTAVTVSDLEPIEEISETNNDGYRLATFPSKGQGGNLGGGQTDSSGNLYVPVGNKVLIYGPDNQPKAVANLPFVAADVAPGPNGAYIYAVDRSLADCATCAPMTPQKLVRGADGNYTVDPTFQLESFDYGGPTRPEGFRIATDATGRLYVAQGIWTQKPVSQVIVYGTDGKVVGRFGDSVVTVPNDPTGGPASWDEEKFWNLSGIAVSPDGKTVYTVESKNNRVQRWDSADGINYSVGDVWGSSLANDPDRNPDTGQPVELLAPYDIGLDDAGNVYVMSTSDAKIVKYTPAGQKITEMYVGGDTPDAYTPGALGHGIAVTAHGDAISVQTGRMMQLVTP